MIVFFSDRKFCIKARLTGALLVTMTMVRNNTTNFRILQPTLQVLKIYTTNSECLNSFVNRFFIIHNMGLINKVDMVCLSPVGYGVTAKHHIPQATNIPYQPC